MQASVLSVCAGSAGSAAAAVGIANAADDGLQRAVLAHAVCESGKDGPAAALERVRREYVPARPEDEQDDEDPETAVAAKTAIHSFSSYSFPANGRLAGECRRVCSDCFLRLFIISYAQAAKSVRFAAPHARKRGIFGEWRSFTCQNKGGLL